MYGMHAVVLWRLLLSARLTLANLQHLDVDDSDVQFAPVPDFKLQPGDLETMAANIGTLQAKAEEAVNDLMDAMTKRAPGTPVAVMIALDEGQRLDELHRGSKERRSGAQWGLYVLRRFQQAMSGHKRVVVPIMTGIDPMTYPVSSEGNNIVLGINGTEAIITLEDALTVVQQFVQNTAPTNELYRGDYADFRQGLLVLMMHPRMRPMIEAIRNNLKPADAADTVAWNELQEKKNRTMLLIAAALRAPISLRELTVDRSLIEQHVALRYAPNNPDVAWPVMDCVVWRHLCPSSDVDEMFGVSVNDPGNPKTFQDLAFFVIGYYLQVYGPLLLGLDVQKTALSEVDKKPENPTPFEVKMLRLSDRESVMQPFNAGDRVLRNDEQKTNQPHDDTPSPQYNTVTERFKKSIGKLQVGCGVWVRCTTRSPLDYLLVVRTSATTALIRFVDAKHTHLLNRLKRSIYESLLPKAQTVHAELQRLLFTPLHITLEPFESVHVFIVTNARDGVNARHAVAFCPTTFIFEPWTSYLYSDSLISTKEEEEEEEEEEEGDEECGRLKQLCI